jgi:hypothetical protein
VLAGHSLLVTEQSNVLKKAASVGYRSNQNRLFSSASTEETVETSDTTKTTKQPKPRWSLQLFGVKVGSNVVDRDLNRKFWRQFP